MLVSLCFTWGVILNEDFLNGKNNGKEKWEYHYVLAASNNYWEKEERFSAKFSNLQNYASCSHWIMWNLSAQGILPTPPPVWIYDFLSFLCTSLSSDMSISLFLFLLIKSLQELIYNCPILYLFHFCFHIGLCLFFCFM